MLQSAEGGFDHVSCYFSNQIIPEIPEKSKKAEIYLTQLRHMHQKSVTNMVFSQRLVYCSPKTKTESKLLQQKLLKLLKKSLCIMHAMLERKYRGSLIDL